MANVWVGALLKAFAHLIPHPDDLDLPGLPVAQGLGPRRRGHPSLIAGAKGENQHGEQKQAAHQKDVMPRPKWIWLPASLGLRSPSSHAKSMLTGN